MSATDTEFRSITPLTAPLDAVVRVPGSKSITNRALVCAALAVGESVLECPLVSDDTEAMRAALAHLGFEVGGFVGESVRVRGSGGAVPQPTGTVDARLSGTTSRFVLAMLTLGAGPYRLDGAEPLRARPMGDGIAALRTLGAEVIDHDQPGHLPVTVRQGSARQEGSAVRAGEVRLRANVSSQFASGLLLTGPVRPDGLTVRLDEDIVSQPYLDLTVAVMVAFGARVDHPDARTYVVHPTGYRATRFVIEPDASAASYFLAAPLIAGGVVQVLGLGPDAAQGDIGFAAVLAEMGAAVTWPAEGVTVRATGTVRGIDADFSQISDTAQTLAAVAPFADGPTTITGIGFIRRKETDRIGAVVTELRRCGIDAEELDDGLRIQPGTPRPATIATYDDHRMAMSFALLGLRAPGIVIADPSCVAKTFPTYWQVLDSLSRGGNLDASSGAPRAD